MPPPTTIFTARTVITMDRSRPEAQAVAVREGRILGAGTVDELRAWGEATVDERFAGQVLIPGFVEAHAHVLEGVFWGFPYLGYYDRRDPEGRLVAGTASAAAAIERLRTLSAAISDPNEPLIAWGYDPIYFPGERLSARHLDAASSTRPIFVLHASGHLATVNTAMLRRSGITGETAVEGVVRESGGTPHGELQELPAIALARDGIGPIARAMGAEDAIWRFGRAARNAGITTVADLAGNALTAPGFVANWQRAVEDPAFPARVVMYPLPANDVATADIEDVAARFEALQASAGEKLRFGGIKLLLDGSIQGYTAVLHWPGYLNGAANGHWLIPPDRFRAIVLALHRHGINIHVHCNGDAPVDLLLDAVEAAIRDTPWLDHRHTIEHCQLATAAQYRRMARLGVCANIFANHLWYWGDQHYESTVGPGRASRMDACGTALREGVPFSIHSDAGVTPLGHLHTMWCAVNRTTPKGRVLGADERISAYDALHAATIGGAYVLRMDHEVGSIETGKRADFAVLDASPLEVDPMAIRDITVVGTVLGGEVFEAARA